MPPRPANAEVWHSVRSDGDTKTEKSRRTLGLPQMALDALQAHKERQAGERLTTDAPLSAHDLVFATRSGGALDAANIRREFKSACKAAGLGTRWTPRELRHFFVSLVSSSGVPIEEIARLAGHSNTRTTEVVYRRELRPVLTTGAEAMDRLFPSTPARGDGKTPPSARLRACGSSVVQLGSVVSTDGQSCKQMYCRRNRSARDGGTFGQRYLHAIRTSTRLTTTDGGRIAAASSARPSLTTLPLTSPRNGSSAGPSSAASSTNMKERHRTPGQDWWPSSETPQGDSGILCSFRR